MRTPVLTLFALLLAVPIAACSSGSGTPACTNPVATTSVELQDYAFSPSCAEAAPDATLTLTNAGQPIHSFTVKGTDLNVSVDAGASAQVSLSGIAPGDYTVVCIYHPQMVGALRVSSG
jgi:plastocyanin